MSFDPEAVQILLDGVQESEYAVDFRERYGTSPFFDEVRKLQLEIADTAVPEDLLESAWGAAQPKIDELNREVSLQGLSGATAILSGQGVEVPSINADLAQLVTRVAPADFTKLTDKTLEQYASADEVTGTFAGVTMLFEKISEGVYRPRFAYRVLIGTLDVPSAFLTLYATGVVGQSTLQFEYDKRLDAVAPILEHLYELCGEHFQLVNEINVALAKNHEPNASTMRHVSSYAEKLIGLIEPDSTAQVEDLLIELISHYTNHAGTTVLKTTEFTVSRGGPKEPPESYRGDDVYVFENEVAGLVFLNRQRRNRNGHIDLLKGRMLHFVIDTYSDGKHRNVYIPAARLKEYSEVW